MRYQRLHRMQNHRFTCICLAERTTEKVGGRNQLLGSGGVQGEQGNKGAGTARDQRLRKANGEEGDGQPIEYAVRSVCYQREMVVLFAVQWSRASSPDISW